jgi:hypothetical protein
MTTRLPVLAALVLLFCAARPARCQEAAPRPPNYRGQIVLADLVALSLGGVAASTHSIQTAYAGLGIYALGGPILHLAHARPDRAFGSLLLRALAPLTGAYIGARVTQDSSLSGFESGIIIGGSLGFLTASILDITLMCHDGEPELPPEKPSLSLLVTGRALGLQGRF